jgi:hypothetical protein
MIYDDLPIQNGDAPVCYIKLPEGNTIFTTLKKTPKDGSTCEALESHEHLRTDLQLHREWTAVSVPPFGYDSPLAWNKPQNDGGKMYTKTHTYQPKLT